MTKKRKSTDSISYTPGITYGDDHPEITKWDIRFESYLSRMDENQSILKERGGFPRNVSQKAFLGHEDHSEEISQWLRERLSQLRDEEKETSKAPVLTGASIGRAVISDIAFTMLESLGEPGPNLEILLAELLNVDRHRQAMANNKSEERTVAAQIEAQKPEIGVRELAKFLRVAPSTVSTWRRETDYQEKVRFFERLFSGEFEIELKKRYRQKSNS